MNRENLKSALKTMMNIKKAFYLMNQKALTLKPNPEMTLLQLNSNQVASITRFRL
jgi:hypothetical protein